MRIGLRVLFVVLSACLASSAPAQSPVVVQHNSDTGSGDTRSKAFTLANGAGHLIFAGIGGYGSTTDSGSCSDTSGNSYTLIVRMWNGSGQTLFARAFYAKNILAAAAGANTVTCILNGQAHTDMVIGEYSGPPTTSPVLAFGIEQALSGSNDFSCPTVCPIPTDINNTPTTLTLTGTNALLVSFTYAQHVATTFGASTGFTVEENTTNPDSESAGLADSTTLAATAGSYSITWTSTVTEDNWGGVLVAFGSPGTAAPVHHRVNMGWLFVFGCPLPKKLEELEDEQS